MDLLKSTIQAITPQDQKSRTLAKQRLDQLTMPPWALGRLMDIGLDIAGMTRSITPSVAGKAIIIMVGDHGVVAEGVSKFPQEVTHQMVANFVNGGAGINALAGQAGARVVVVDMGVAADTGHLAKTGKIISHRIAAGTGNIAQGPAMSHDQAIASIEAGISVALDLADEIDLFGTGDMGIGNTTPSTAIVAALTRTSVSEVCGRGTGLDDRQLEHKIKIIEQALAINSPNPDDGLDVLAKVGGFEIGGIAGVILGAASRHKPVLVDGFISTAGALIAHSLCPTAGQYIIAAHRSVEKGHAIMHAYLGLEPLLDLNMRLGEGTGAALAMNIVEAAVAVLTEVATFNEAQVAGADK